MTGREREEKTGMRKQWFSELSGTQNVWELNVLGSPNGA
jgi:hypothetical protein